MNQPSLLVVDDEPGVRESLRHVFGGDFRVSEAENEVGFICTPIFVVPTTALKPADRSSPGMTFSMPSIMSSQISKWMNLGFILRGLPAADI